MNNGKHLQPHQNAIYKVANSASYIRARALKGLKVSSIMPQNATAPTADAPRQHPARPANKFCNTPAKQSRSRLKSRQALAGPMLENILDHAVAPATESAGLSRSNFADAGFPVSVQVAGGMAESVMTGARRDPCFQHPSHLSSLKTRQVDCQTHHGATTMHQAPARAITPTTANTATNPPQPASTAMMRQIAINALELALQALRSDNLTLATVHADSAASLIWVLKMQADGGAQ